MRFQAIGKSIFTAIGILFVLTHSTNGHVLLDEPNGGEVLQAGTVFTITWHVDVEHNTQNWDLWYSTTGEDGPWISIVEDLPAGDTSTYAVHTFEWTVPDDASTQVRVRVRQDNAGKNYYDISNDDLIIEAAPDIPGDSDGDGDVDLADFAIYLDCETGPDGEGVSGECEALDFDGDDDVDLVDFEAFQLAFTG